MHDSQSSTVVFLKMDFYNQSSIESVLCEKYS